uniref:Uncharacterized protein n=1 Tax=Anopheles atroparvus TaxID=41427 RepID=A0A182J2V5_ANOAO
MPIGTSPCRVRKRQLHPWRTFVPWLKRPLALILWRQPGWHFFPPSSAPWSSGWMMIFGPAKERRIKKGKTHTFEWLILAALLHGMPLLLLLSASQGMRVKTVFWQVTLL